MNKFDNDYFESPTYLDSKAFKAYCAKVRHIIEQSETPVTVRFIHLVLRENAKPEWTADALEMITGIERVGILPTRYRIVQYRRQVSPPTPFGRTAR